MKIGCGNKNGYWVFANPIGYRYQAVAGWGKMLVRNEPLASIITKGLEGYAMGRFKPPCEVRRFIESHPDFPIDKYRGVTFQRTVIILDQPLYAGYLVHDCWDIDWIKAHHQPLISLETFEKTQRRRKEGAIAPARADINLDFPLRGFVVCADCDNLLTACCSKGSNAKYAYYLCHSRGGLSYCKSIPRAKIEDACAEIVRSLQPTRKLVSLAKAMSETAWAQRTDQFDARQDTVRTQRKELD